MNVPHISLVSSPSVNPMGSSSSSSSRLFGTLAQSLTSAPLAQPDPFLEKNLDQDPDLDLVATDPDQLLRECERALQKRPARPHRDLVYPNGMTPCPHKSNSSIRIMQWNILAQGICGYSTHFWVWSGTPKFLNSVQSWLVSFKQANWFLKGVS